MKIGFIGLGIMGESMCENIVKKHDDTVYCFDFIPAKVELLASKGAVPCKDSVELAEKSDVIISMVPKSEHSMSVYKTILPVLGAGKTCIDMSTIDPSVSVEISKMLPAMIALIALTQVVQKLRDFKVAGGKLDDARKIDKQGITKKEMVSILPACLRSSAIASVLGAMPGVGGGVAQFLCYNEVRRTSKHPEEFGKGCLEGIAAAESSNNAVVGSAMIPLLTLGIPGDGVTALLLGAFVLHGIQPGPTMFTKQGVMAYTIIIGCLVANVLLAPLGLGMTRLVAKIVQVRYTYLAPVIIMFCFAGAFAATGNTKELIICAGILIFSYILTVLDIDNTPLMLGMILEDIMEQNFVTASMSYDRNYSIFITRPISAVILIITVVLLVSMIRVNRRVAKLNEQQEAQMAAEHAKMENA